MYDLIKKARLTSNGTETTIFVKYQKKKQQTKQHRIFYKYSRFRTVTDQPCFFLSNRTFHYFIAD